MISPDALTQYSYIVSSRFEAINSHYIELMAKQIREIGKLSPSNLHRLQQMAKMSANIEEINRLLAKETKRTLDELYQVYEISGMSEYGDTLELYKANGVTQVPFEMNRAIQNHLASVYELTKGTFQNLSNTTALSEVYQNLVDEAIENVTQGTTDYKSAIRSRLTEASLAGTRVVYASGKTRRLDSAVRMNILEGIRQVNNGVREITGQEFGADGVEISAHAICAPDHLDIQGRQFSKKQFSLINSELKRKISTCNCKHFIKQIVLGISEPTYSPQELQNFKNNSEKKVNVNGKEMTLYEATQTMRKLETQMRYAKDMHIAGTHSGDKELVKRADTRLNTLRATYRKVCQDAGLAKKYDRAYVPGFSGKQAKPSGVKLSSAPTAPSNDSALIKKFMPVSKVPEIRTIQSKLVQLDDMYNNPKALDYIGEAGSIVRKQLKDSVEKAKTKIDSLTVSVDTNKKLLSGVFTEDDLQLLDRKMNTLSRRRKNLQDATKAGDAGEIQYWKNLEESSMQEIQKYIDKADSEGVGHIIKQYMDDSFELYVKKREYKGTITTNVDRMVKLLSKYRTLGVEDVSSITKHLKSSRSPMRKVVEQAYQIYPREWVESSISNGTLSVKKVDRGYYNHWAAEIAISGNGDPQSLETAIHELGHRFERTSGLSSFEKLLYDKRTAGEDLGWLGPGYGKSEVTRKDNWLNPYMGKDYGGRAYELISMGFEYAYTDPTKLIEDEEFADFIFGLLAMF